MKPNDLFTPGPAGPLTPAGDPARQAIDSLKGYAYQISAAALAWLAIGIDGKLFLEVAEDYAIVAGQALSAVQVKDTAGSGSVTLNTDSVRDAVVALVDLISRNPGRTVDLRYFTTSSVGTERALADRPGGEPGLVYWRKAAGGADLAPLRSILDGKDYPDSVRSFVRSRDDDTLRHDLLQKIHWDWGKPDFATVGQELEARLIVLGRDQFHLPADEARRLADVLMYHVLKKSILKNPEERVLSRSELYATIDAATCVSVPRAALDNFTQLAAAFVGALTRGAEVHGAFAAAELGWLIDGNQLPAPRAVISRMSLEDTVAEALADFGAGVLVGGSGLGKSLVSRAVGKRRGTDFAIVDLSDVDADETRRRLDVVFGRIGGMRPSVMVLEDLNHFDNPRVALSLGRVIEALRRRDCAALITCYRKPTVRTLADVDVDARAVVDSPYFSESEVKELVRINGGDPDKWGPLAYVSGAQGHPQLTHAFVVGMAKRGWPLQDMRDVVIRGLTSDDIDAARDAARRNLASALPEGARSLLYRLSLVAGRFDRPLALDIGALAPAILQTSESMDELVGPWIEVVARNLYRVSPLASTAGHEALSGEQQKSIHELIATKMLSRETIDAADANMILMHALAGKSESSLAALSYSVLTATTDSLGMLAESFFILRLVRTDRPIYPEDRSISGMLRLAQFTLMAAANEGDKLAECAHALLQENSREPNARLRGTFEVLALCSVLSTMGISNYLDDWLDMLRRLKALVETDTVFQSMKANLEEPSGDGNVSFYGMLFNIGATGMSSVERLEHVIDGLNALDAEERALWLTPGDRSFSDFSVFINGPWASEHTRNAVDATDAATRYQRMAEVMKGWGIRPLPLQCFAARSVMLDEYAGDKEAALAALDEAVATLGEDVILTRARAKIYWRHNDYQKSLQLLRSIADQVGRGNPVERAFAMREAAISAANVGEWDQAEAWFLEGQSAAAFGQGDDMRAMSIGLGADAAVAALKVGQLSRALKHLAETLVELQGIDADASLRTAYCHRVLRHTVLWFDSEIEHNDVKIGGEPIAMLPGTCSNPEPLPSIRDLPLGSLDIAWYMLAEAEISAGVDVGISSELRQRLVQGPILYFEVDLRKRRMSAAIRGLDHDAFAIHLWSYLDGMAYLRDQGSDLKTSFDVLAPTRGEVPQLGQERRSDPFVKELAVDAVFAYCIVAACTDRGDAISGLKDALECSLGTGYPGEVVFDYWESKKAAFEGLDKTIADMIDFVRQGEHIEPSTFWIIGLRFLEKANRSNFKRAFCHLLRSRNGPVGRGSSWRRVFVCRALRERFQA